MCTHPFEGFIVHQGWNHRQQQTLPVFKNQCLRAQSISYAVHSCGMREPHHRSIEPCAHRETKKLFQKHKAHSHLGPQARGTKCPQQLLLPNTKCMHAGLSQGLQHMPTCSNKQKNGQTLCKVEEGGNQCLG